MFRTPRLHASLFTAAVVAALAGHARAQCATPDHLVAPDPSIEAYNGSSVAIDGNYILTGASGKDIGANVDEGKVYGYTLVNGAWTQVAALVPNPATSSMHFGGYIALGGGAQWGVVGAWGANNENGAAYFFHRDPNTGVWTQTQSFTQNFGFQSRFGQGVAMNKDATIAAISVPYADLTDANGTWTVEGRVMIYTRSGNTWTFERELKQMNPAYRHNGDIYGYSVAVDGSTVVIGASNASTAAHPQCGYAQVWTRDAQANWSTTGPIFSPEEATEGYFGTGVAIQGDTMAIGSDGVKKNGMTFVGAAFIYRLVNGAWTLESKVEPSNPTPVQCFGGPMKIDNGRLVVGANNMSGRVYLFKRQAPGQWVQDAYFEGNADYGVDVALEGSNLVVGAPADPVTGILNAGQTFRYDLGGAPGSDSCEGATPVVQGTYQGCTDKCTLDGATTCGNAVPNGPDIWFRYTAPSTGSVTIDTQGSTLDTVLSVHAGCPGTAANSIACSDDFAAPQRWSKVSFVATQGQTYLVRVAGYGGVTGPFTLNVGSVQACYPNCDGSSQAPILNVADFGCFLQKYGAGDPYANCDGSVQPPVLNVADFTCFLQKYATGCP